MWHDDPAALVRAVECATPFLEFRIDRLLDAADVGSLEGRARAAEQAAKLIGEHPSDLVRDQYVMKLASRLDIDADRLRTTVGRARSGEQRRDEERDRNSPPGAGSTAPGHAVDPRELDALRWVIHAPELFGGRIGSAMFADPLARAAFDTLAGADEFHDALGRSAPDVGALIERLAVEVPETSGEDPETLVRHVVVLLVEASSKRVLESMLRNGDERTPELKALADMLARECAEGDWGAAEISAERLVGWLAQMAEWR